METIAFLDPHVVVWLHSNHLSKFSEKAKNHLETHDLFISPMVMLELQYLFEIKKLSDNNRYSCF